MANITREMYEATYLNAKKVYNRQIPMKDAIDIMVHDFGMNPTSADFYLHSYQDMTRGSTFKKTINNKAMEYYLNNILIDNNFSGLRMALNSVEKHIIYYEEDGKRKVVGLRKIYNKYLSISLANEQSINADEISDKKGKFEGAKLTVTVNRYERDPIARKDCLDKYKAICAVCTLDFKEEYGDIGADFIHVHHLVPLSEIGREYQVNPIKDLIPVCPNCHSMLHKRKPPHTIEGLKEMIKSAGGDLSFKL